MGRKSTLTAEERIAALAAAKRRHYLAHKEEYNARVLEWRRKKGFNVTGQRGRPRKADQTANMEPTNAVVSVMVTGG